MSCNNEQTAIWFQEGGIKIILDGNFMISVNHFVAV